MKNSGNLKVPQAKSLQGDASWNSGWETRGYLPVGKSCENLFYISILNNIFCKICRSEFYFYEGI